jgi:hypothetical protein
VGFASKGLVWDATISTVEVLDQRVSKSIFHPGSKPAAPHHSKRLPAETASHKSMIARTADNLFVETRVNWRDRRAENVRAAQSTVSLTMHFLSVIRDPKSGFLNSAGML